MALELLVVDTATNTKQKKTVAQMFSSLYDDQKYTVGGGGQSLFVVTKTFDVNSKIDVFVNGNMVDESDDYTRNSVLNRIEFSYTVPQYAKVMIRVW